MSSSNFLSEVLDQGHESMSIFCSASGEMHLWLLDSCSLFHSHHAASHHAASHHAASHHVQCYTSNWILTNKLTQDEWIIMEASCFLSLSLTSLAWCLTWFYCWRVMHIFQAVDVSVLLYSCTTKDAACCFEQILEAAPHRVATTQSLASHYVNEPSKTSNTC